MEKKLWSNAEIVELGVENTREEGYDEPKEKCPYCGFETYHEKNLAIHILRTHPGLS